MFVIKRTMINNEVISIVLFLLCLVLGQELDDDTKNIVNAKLVPQVSETRCLYDADCLQENSYCKGNDAAATEKSGFCACKENHFIQTVGKNFQCFPFVDGIGSSCVVDRQCVTALGTNNAYCDDTEGCQCEDGHHFHGNRCYKIASINETCQSNYNCQINTYISGNIKRTGFAHCVYGRCACGLNEHYKRNSNSCVQSITIGSKCNSDDECNIADESALCRIVCACRVGWVVADQGRTCLKAATEVGQLCTQLSQCTEFLGADSLCELSTNSCQCKPFAYHAGSKCFSRRYLGDTCSHRIECQISQYQTSSHVTVTDLLTLVDCVEGVCRCVAGAEQMGSDCVGDGTAESRNGIRGSTGNTVIVLGVAVILFLFCVN